MGFFVKAVQEEYSIPEGEVGQASNNNYNTDIPSNMRNFDQREYTEKDFEQYYFKVEE